MVPPGDFPCSRRSQALFDLWSAPQCRLAYLGGGLAGIQLDVPPGHGAPRYQLAAQAAHVHLVCSQCGRIIQVDPAVVRPLTAALDDEHGFETDVGHLTVFGRCAECRATGPDLAASGEPATA